MGLLERKLKDYFSRGRSFYLALMDAIACGSWLGRDNVWRERSEPSFEGNQQRREAEVVTELVIPPPHQLFPMLPSALCSTEQPSRSEPPPPAWENRCFCRLRPALTQFHQLPGEAWVR